MSRRVLLSIALAAVGMTLDLGPTPVLARPATASPILASDRIAQSGRWFVDAQGRVVTLRGGNVMLPAALVGDGQRWSARTPLRMAENGFNGVRLVVFFSEIMPKPGQVDTAYLDRIAATVAAYKAAGVYVLIDFHQDEYGAKVGVRGMPDWAVFTDGHVRRPELKFPIGYFEDPAVQHAFDNFWSNHPAPVAGKGVQDLYIDGLAAVAKRFRNEPAVLGIDVMNEPATGSRCATPDPATAHCPELERTLLAPFYKRAAAAINAAAPDMIVFVEPFMLQGALGTPIDTPVAGAKGRRALSFHNYGPVKATRDRVNDGALATAVAKSAAIINTEWGYSNDPAEVVGQAVDFDARHISWLAWTRGAFEALVDPDLPDRGNGQRLAILRAYARPYAERTAGTPKDLSFDPIEGVLTYRYATLAPNGRRAIGGLTRIRLPAIQYPQGYRVEVENGVTVSAQDAPVLDVRAAPNAKDVRVVVTRVGTLPPLPAAKIPAEGPTASLPPLPPGPLSRNSLLGHVVAVPGGREVLEGQVPGLLKGLSHVAGWERMTLASIQKFASGVLTEAKLSAIDADLAKLDPTAAKLPGARLSIDSMTSDLLADPRARAILDREAPGLANAPQQSLYPQTRLRDLQPALPKILTPQALQRIDDALAANP